jgi:hypothetical protein
MKNLTKAEKTFVWLYWLETLLGVLTVVALFTTSLIMLALEFGLVLHLGAIGLTAWMTSGAFSLAKAIKNGPDAINVAAKKAYFRRNFTLPLGLLAVSTALLWPTHIDSWTNPFFLAGVGNLAMFVAETRSRTAMKIAAALRNKPADDREIAG